MADNKNQHYVPKAHLRRFSLDGHTINLFNLKQKDCKAGAPFRDQCSKDYFYCKDDRDIPEIKEAEDPYGAAVNALEAGARLDEDIALDLRRFIFFQHLRTDMALGQAIAFFKAATELERHVDPEADERDAWDESVGANVAAFNLHFPEIADLKTCIVCNKTDVPFVTSDHPAILANPYHTRKNLADFGVGSAGALMMMPLSPTLLALLYDGDVYSITHKDRILELENVDDVDALNDFQFLNCHRNVYFHAWQDCSYVKARAERTLLQRPASFQEVFFVRHNLDGTQQKMEPDQFKTSDEGHMEGHFHRPAPSRWPSFLPVRPDATAWETGHEKKLLRSHSRGLARYKDEKACKISL